MNLLRNIRRSYKQRVYPPLLLIEQTTEQHDRRPQLIGQDRRLGQRAEQPGLGQRRVARQQLLAPNPPAKTGLLPLPYYGARSTIVE